jgi:dihydroorotate dehydrogenase electron transfer subunit
LRHSLFVVVNKNYRIFQMSKVRMAKDIYIGEILKNEEIQPQYFLMKVALPVAFGEPMPGQFVMIRIVGIAEPFLGRPISIYSFRRKKSFYEIELLYRVVGKGTQILAGLISRSQVEIHGPLGGSYKVFPEKEKIVFIAGGIGVAPLSLLAQHLCKNVCIAPACMSFYLGAQTAKEIVGLDKLTGLCNNMQICTDDGTLGRKALVTSAFQKDIKKYDPASTAVYACGPKGMMRALAGILGKSNFNCQVSLEERMACGTGACMGCAVAIKDKTGNAAYRRVCSDGPVFNLEDVIWE